MLFAAAVSNGQSPVVMASGVLQKCLGIVPGADKMNRGPEAEQFCKQLPGAAFYDQAGARLKDSVCVVCESVSARRARISKSDGHLL
jgi:hypothetical protein